MKNIYVFFVIILLAVFACKKDEDIQSTPGYFQLAQIQHPDLKNVSDHPPPVQTEFSLGDLKASNEFFFLLTNGGQKPIFDIQLETDHSQFTVLPDSISYLSGKGETSRSQIIPLISVGAIHGTQLNGIGYADLLPMGENTAILTIKGKTINKGDTITIESDFSLEVDAKIMDIALTLGGSNLNLSNPTGMAIVGINFGGLGGIRYYKGTSSTLNILNTGNVDIIVKIYQQDPVSYKYVVINEISLSKGLAEDLILNKGLTVFELDSKGTITDDSRIQLGNDGKGYFGIENY